MHLRPLPGVVDENLDVAEHPFRLRQHSFELCKVAHVNMTCDRATAFCYDFPGDAFGAGVVLVRYDDRRAFAGEALRSGGADTGGSACDDRSRTGKFLAHVIIPVFEMFFVRTSGRQQQGGLRTVLH